MTEAQAQELGPTGRPLRVYPDPAPLSSHGPARIISMVNQKGGVGKTTSTINLGAALAECGRKVLLVDFDPQGALSAGFGANPHELDLTVYNVMMDRKVDIKDVILPTGVENIDLLPANIDLSAAEVQLVNEVAREQVLASALRKVRDEYDVILIDCQPSLGLLTVNALTASDGVIIPLTAEFFARRGRLRRQGLRHRHQAHREVPGRLGVCRADSYVCFESPRCRGLPPGGTRTDL